MRRRAKLGEDLPAGRVAGFVKPALALCGMSLVLLALGRPAAARATAPPERPTPREWDQWQPQTDQSDSRLDTAVSAWERDTRLDDLLSQLSDSSGVALTATEDLLPQRLSIYCDARSLAAAMAGLAQLYQGYWAFRRGDTPGERVYCLVEVRPAAAVAREVMAAVFRAIVGRSMEEQGESLRRRLDLYRYALGLSPDAVLARYEQTDPWLCADLLQQEIRPLVAFVCRLTEDRRAQLINASTLVLPASELDQEAKTALRWCETASTELYTAHDTSEEDRRAYFDGGDASAGDSGANVIRLLWGGFGVRLQLLTATMMYEVGVVTMADLPPGDARRRLLDLGYGERTPDRLAAIEKEDEAWQQSHRVIEALDQIEAQYMPAAPSGDDALLSTALVPEDSWRSGVPVADLLATVSEQLDLLVLGDVLPPGDDVCGVDSTKGKATLGEVLEGIRSLANTTWHLRGQTLVVATTVPRVVESGERADILVWIERRYPVVARLMEDMFSVLVVPVH